MKKGGKKPQDINQALNTDGDAPGTEASPLRFTTTKVNISKREKAHEYI